VAHGLRAARPAKEGVMIVATLRQVAAAVLVCSAVGCASRAQTLSPVHALPREAISNDPVPGERYYLLVFGSQTTPRVPRFSHTWATVVKTVEASDGAPQVAEVHTISWLPADLALNPWRFTPEPGRNLELDETIRLTLRFREHITMWGPYEIQPQAYRRFLLQKAYMESGRVGYQAIDTVGKGADGSGCDCIHAITDMDPEFDRGYYPLIRYGFSGSRFIVRQVFERKLLISEDTHPWLETPLGLCNYPIDRRSYRDRPHLFGRMGL
jgi:hypothetical protein